MDMQSEEIRQLAEEFQGCRRVLLALGDENRQHMILEMMQMGECQGVRVGEITARTHLSRPAVSHHLQILKGAGILKCRREGTRNYYYFDADAQAMGALYDCEGGEDEAEAENADTDPEAGIATAVLSEGYTEYLQETIDEYTPYLEKTDTYTADSLAELKETLDYAQTVLDNAASYEEYDGRAQSAAWDIQSAVNRLVLISGDDAADEDNNDAADGYDVRAFTTDAEAYQEYVDSDEYKNKYTEESLKELQAAIDAANTLVAKFQNGETVTHGQLNEASKALNSAERLLVVRTDAKATAEELEHLKYYADSAAEAANDETYKKTVDADILQKLADAAKAGQELVEKGEGSVSLIDYNKAIYAINKAWNELYEATEDTDNNEIGPIQEQWLFGQVLDAKQVLRDKDSSSQYSDDALKAIQSAIDAAEALRDDYKAGKSVTYGKYLEAYEAIEKALQDKKSDTAATEDEVSDLTDLASSAQYYINRGVVSGDDATALQKLIDEAEALAEKDGLTYGEYQKAAAQLANAIRNVTGYWNSNLVEMTEEEVAALLKEDNGGGGGEGGGNGGGSGNGEPKSPQTGDDANLALYVLLCLASLTGLAVLAVRRKHNN